MMASVVPVYFVWITPELFNFSLGLLAYFCWLYKEVATPEQAPCGHALAVRADERRRAPRSCSASPRSRRSPNALLFPPIVAWLVWQRAMAPGDPEHAWRSASVAGRPLRRQHGDLRRVELPGRPGPQHVRHRVPVSDRRARASRSAWRRRRNEALTDIIFDRRVFWTNLAHNLGYFFVGRYSGPGAVLLPGGLRAGGVRSSAPRRRPAWQYLVLAAVLGADADLHHRHAVHVARRRRLGRQPLLHGRLRRVPVPAAAAVAVVAGVRAVGVGGLFTAPLVLNPFVASF